MHTCRQLAFALCIALVSGQTSGVLVSAVQWQVDKPAWLPVSGQFIFNATTGKRHSITDPLCVGFGDVYQLVSISRNPNGLDEKDMLQIGAWHNTFTVDINKKLTVKATTNWGDNICGGDSAAVTGTASIGATVTLVTPKGGGCCQDEGDCWKENITYHGLC
jgi:hypothetical protein